MSKVAPAEDLGRCPSTFAGSHSIQASPSAPGHLCWEKLGLPPREIWAGAPYLQAGQQSGCKSKGLFSLWDQDLVCIIHQPFCRWQGLATPICTATRGVPKVSVHTWLLSPCPGSCPKCVQTLLSAPWGRIWLCLRTLITRGEKVCYPPQPCPSHQGGCSL